MRGQLTALFALALAVVAIFRLSSDSNASSPPPSSLPPQGRATINGVWIGESKKEVEGLHGPGSPVANSTPLAFTYPQGGDEHTIRVFYDQDQRVLGVKGYELQHNQETFRIGSPITTLIQRFGDPGKVTLDHRKPGSSVELFFTDELRVWTVLTQTGEHKLTLPDYVDGLSLGYSQDTATGPSYAGKGMELRKRQPQDSQVTIFCQGTDILR